MLLYRYAVESFLVTECQHIYVKSELYRCTREAMKQLMTDGEIARINVLCGVPKCVQFAPFRLSQGRTGG